MLPYAAIFISFVICVFELPAGSVATHPLQLQYNMLQYSVSPFKDILSFISYMTICTNSCNSPHYTD